MEDFDAIRRALADDASADERRAGAAACERVLAAVATARSAPPAHAASAPHPAAQMPALVALRAMPRAQLYETITSKLRALMPAAAPMPALPDDSSIAALLQGLPSLSLDQLLDLGVNFLRERLDGQARPAAMTPASHPTPPSPAPPMMLTPAGQRVRIMRGTLPARRRP